MVLLTSSITTIWSKLPNTADNKLIEEFGQEHRNVIPIFKIPRLMQLSVLAAEDNNFYKHNGIDWLSAVRAFWGNLISGSKNQGARTITMQLARNFYLSHKKTYLRKFYELLLTIKIESIFTKDKILELYMNQIYLGHRTYGFEAASLLYLGKSLRDGTPDEFDYYLASQRLHHASIQFLI